MFEKRKNLSRLAPPPYRAYLWSFIFFGCIAAAALFAMSCGGNGCSAGSGYLYRVSDNTLPAAPAIHTSIEENYVEVWIELGETGVFTPTSQQSAFIFVASSLPTYLDELGAKGYVAIRVPHVPPTYTESSLVPGIPPWEPNPVTFSYYSPPSTDTLTTVPVSVTRHVDLEEIVDQNFPIADGHSHWEVWWLPPGESFPIPDEPFRLDAGSWPPPLGLRFRIDFVDGGAYPCAGCPVEVLFYNGYVFIGPYQAELRYTDPGGPLDPAVTFGAHCNYEATPLMPSVVQYITPTVPFSHTYCLENWDTTTRTFTIDTASSEIWNYQYYYRATGVGATPVPVAGTPFTVEVGPYIGWAPGMLGLLAVNIPTLAITDTLRESLAVTATSILSPEVQASAVSFALAPGYTLNETGLRYELYLPLVLNTP
jgi:hypothetical protein